jgi:hypothetical protein
MEQPNGKAEILPAITILRNQMVESAQIELFLLGVVEFIRLFAQSVAPSASTRRLDLKSLPSNTLPNWSMSSVKRGAS